MARATVVVQLTAGPSFFVPALLGRWDDTVEDARSRGHQVRVEHLPLAAGTTWSPGASGHTVGPDDVLVVARPQDLPSRTLVGDLADAVLAGAPLAGPRLLPLEDGVPEESAPIEALGRVTSCLALRAGALDSLGPDSLDPDSLDRAAAGGRVVPTATLFRDRRVTTEGPATVGAVGLLSDPPLEELLPAPAATAPVLCGPPESMPETAVSQLVRQLGLDLAPSRGATQHHGPFLSVVTRTRGTRLLMLGDTLASLAAQTDRDFEVLLACHRVETDRRAPIRELVASQPAWLRDRVRLLDVDRPGRSAPLNDALDAASGRYVTVLDDDDTVLGHWVSTFRALEAQAPGRVLRAASVRQHSAQLGEDGSADGLGWPVVTGPPELAWPAAFDLVAHLHINSTPNLSVAFPRGVVHHLGLRFDESLPTTEDWDYLVRAAAITGVVDSPEPTSVYRWFSAASSRQEHSHDVWESGHRRVRESFDRMLMVLPRGAATLSVATHEELYGLRGEMARIVAAEAAEAESEAEEATA